MKSLTLEGLTASLYLPLPTCLLLLLLITKLPACTYQTVTKEICYKLNRDSQDLVSTRNRFKASFLSVLKTPQPLPKTTDVLSVEHCHCGHQQHCCMIADQCHIDWVAFFFNMKLLRGSECIDLNDCITTISQNSELDLGGLGWSSAILFCILDKV